MLALLVESWIWYGVVMLVAAARFISRRMLLGSFAKYQADDYLMMIALCFYTTLIATINIVRDTSSNLLPPNFDVSTLDQQEIHDRAYGSKLILVVEQCQCVVIWLVKGCLVVLYLRLTTARRENIAVKALGAYIIIAFIVMDSLYFGYWCQPFSNYWAVPTPNRQCDTATNHLIMNAAFNLTSDLAILAIGLPMFIRLNLPLKKKIPVILIFSLSIFTIIAAILNKVYSFTQPFGSQWTYWYTRESSTALLVANLPFVWTVFRRAFGPETVHGLSRQNSAAPETALSMSRSRSMTYIPDSSQSSTKPGISWFRSNSLAELELDDVRKGSRTRDMTLEEILKLDAPEPATGEKEPTELTHPHLFWSRRKFEQQMNLEPSGLETAVLSEGPERETVRRSSSLSSTTVEKRGSKKSANSLV